MGRGVHASVWRNSVGSSVSKRYLSHNGSSSRHLADLEFESLKQVAALLKPVPGIRCPEPYYVDEASGDLVMEYSPGIPLYIALARREFSHRETLQSSAKRYAQALLSLSQNLTIEELDLSVRNTLYDPTSGDLVMIDFTSREPSIPLPENGDQVDFLLGSFLSGALTISLHRSTSLNFQASRRMILFCEYLTEALSISADISLANVRDVAWRSYWHRSRNSGILRRVWFSTIGCGIYSILLSRVLRN